MRQALSGLPRSAFQARLSGVDANGNVILENVETPNGILSHLWIPRTTWPVSRMLIGMNVRFTASVRPYQKRGGMDWGLADISGLEVLP
jgi:hypothetical protein